MAQKQTSLNWADWKDAATSDEEDYGPSSEDTRFRKKYLVLVESTGEIVSVHRSWLFKSEKRYYYPPASTVIYEKALLMRVRPNISTWGIADYTSIEHQSDRFRDCQKKMKEMSDVEHEEDTRATRQPPLKHKPKSTSKNTASSLSQLVAFRKKNQATTSSKTFDKPSTEVATLQNVYPCESSPLDEERPSIEPSDVQILHEERMSNELREIIKLQSEMNKRLKTLERNQEDMMRKIDTALGMMDRISQTSIAKDGKEATADEDDRAVKPNIEDYLPLKKSGDVSYIDLKLDSDVEFRTMFNDYLMKLRQHFKNSKSSLDCVQFLRKIFHEKITYTCNWSGQTRSASKEEGKRTKKTRLSATTIVSILTNFFVHNFNMTIQQAEARIATFFKNVETAVKKNTKQKIRPTQRHASSPRKRKTPTKTTGKTPEKTTSQPGPSSRSDSQSPLSQAPTQVQYTTRVLRLDEL